MAEQEVLTLSYSNWVVVAAIADHSKQLSKYRWRTQPTRSWYVITVYSCVVTVPVSVCSREHYRMNDVTVPSPIDAPTSEGFKGIHYSYKHSQSHKLRTPDITSSLSMSVTVVLPDPRT